MREYRLGSSFGDEEATMITRYYAEYLFVGDSGSDLLEPGIVDVADGRVLWSGPAHNAQERPGASRIDVPGLLMPGFVNTHCHTPMVLLRGAGEGLPVNRWLNEVVWPREGRLTPEDVYWGMTLGGAELLRNGVTSSVEMYFHPDQVALAASGAKLRCTVTPPIIEDADLSRLGTVDHQLSTAIDLGHRWSEHDLIDIGLGPHSVYALSDEVLRKVARIAAAEDLMVHIHLAEQSYENDLCLERYGRPLVPYLEDIGMFESHLLVAHGVWLTDDDQTRLAEHSVGVAHCPASNGRHASGIAPVVDLRQRGIPVGLGTDGPASHSRLDMFAEMRLAIRMARLRALNAELLTPTDALAMATSEAAAALARSDIGTLQPGRWADMVNVAIEGSSFTPVLEPEDLITHLVWSGSPSDIRSVWVGGHQVVDDGHCLTVDVAEAQREVTIRARRLAEN
jgi:5-methylthioadenosine/S-adenosylhomocysteine deaminase